MAALQRERRVLESLEGSGLPVPRCLTFHATGDAAWLVSTYLPGPTLWHALHADPHHPQREAWFLGLGATLGRIHATPVPAALEDQSATPWLDDQRRRRAAAAPEAPAQWLERRRATASRVIDV